MHSRETSSWWRSALRVVTCAQLRRSLLQVPITRVEKFGVIVAFTPTKDGLCHKSELDSDPGVDPARFSVGQLIDIKLLDVSSPALWRALTACHRSV